MNKPAQNNSSSGFTLVELLVVVAIIGLMAGVVVAFLNPAEYLKQARDARRISDLLSIQTTLITALTGNAIQLTTTADCNTCDSLSGTFAVDGTGWIKFTDSGTIGLSNYLAILPRDPINESNLVFSYHSDGVDFELNTILESEKYADFMQQDGGNDENVYERGLSLTIN